MNWFIATSETALRFFLAGLISTSLAALLFLFICSGPVLIYECDKRNIRNIHTLFIVISFYCIEALVFCFILAAIIQTH